MHSSAMGGAIFGVVIVYAIVMVFLVLIPAWRVFAKAGQPGWGSLIPIYNIYLMCKICGRPGWWLLLFLVPIANFIVMIILCIDLAKVFGKSAGFAVGLILLGFIFLPILGYGKSEYKGVQKPAAA
jgi:hypothetical protein